VLLASSRFEGNQKSRLTRCGEHLLNLGVSRHLCLLRLPLPSEVAPMKREIAIERLGIACGIFISAFFMLGALASLIAQIEIHQGSLHLPPWNAVKPHLATFGIWAGTCAGVLTAIDWFTPTDKKNRIKDLTVSIWVWLAAQKSGTFTKILLSRNTQRAFAVFTHATIALLILAFLGKSHGLYRVVTISLELGHPRLYSFQVWVDILALALSSWLFGWKLYPRIATWIANTPKIGTYFKRALGAYGCSWLLLWLVLAVQSPILFVMFSHDSLENPAAEAHAIELALHGKVVVVILHAVTAVLTAPVMAGLLMLQTVVFLSFYWVVIVAFTMIVFRAVQYFIERIAAGSQGPVLAVSALLVALSAALKILL
jgi:hypothetical protein